MFLKFPLKELAIQSAAVTQLVHKFKAVACSNNEICPGVIFLSKKRIKPCID